MLAFPVGSDPQPTLHQPDPNPTRDADEQQRRVRRKISNRESARRSRMRKQRHLEDVRCHVSRLKALNQELSNRVGLFAHQNLLVQSDNQRLRSEWRILHYRLTEIRRVLQHRMSFCGFGYGNEQSVASLID